MYLSIHFFKFECASVASVVEVANASRWKTGIQEQLYAPKLGTQYHVTKVTSDDVTMMTSWWNTSGML